MRSLDDALIQHLALSTTTLCTCWRIKRNDGAVETFTSHDQPFIIDGNTYKPSGISETETQNSMDLNADSVELHGLVENESDLSAQIFSKLYDKAQIDIFQTDYTNPPNEVTASSVIWIKTGVIGDIDREKGKWVVEAKSLIDLLEQKTMLKTSRLCRAEFGDENCRADLTQYQKTGTVTGISNRTLTFDIGSLSTGDLEQGKVEFTNYGISFDILNNSGSRATLSDYIEFNPVGEPVVVTFGCNKWLDDCEKYGNVINFFGEPYIPDEDDWAAGYFNTISV